MTPESVIRYSVTFHRDGNEGVEITKVTSDGVMQPAGRPIMMRWFELEDHVRIEVPMEGTIFYFSAEREKAIRQSKTQGATGADPTH